MRHGRWTETLQLCVGPYRNGNQQEILGNSQRYLSVISNKQTNKQKLALLLEQQWFLCYASSNSFTLSSTQLPALCALSFSSRRLTPSLLLAFCWFLQWGSSTWLQAASKCRSNIQLIRLFTGLVHARLSALNLKLLLLCSAHLRYHKLPTVLACGFGVVLNPWLPLPDCVVKLLALASILSAVAVVISHSLWGHAKC